MIRKSYLPFLLPILLLFAQQAAVVHELGHLATEIQRVQERNPRPEPQQLPGTTCEICIVFAHFAGAVAPYVPSLVTLPLAHALSGRIAVTRRTADSVVARSRGPPSIL